MPTTSCYLISFNIIGGCVTAPGKTRNSAASNRTIVNGLKNGRREACARLADAFQNRLLYEAVNVFGLNAQDSEELVSDVLVSVVTKIHSFEFKRHDSDFSGWVIRIFRNRVRDYVRQRAAAEESFVEFIDDPLTKEDAYSPQERELANYILHQYEQANREADEVGGGPVSAKLVAIADVLDRLESWERVLLRCRALDVAYEEIAGYTRKPVSHLKVYHGRVKKKFIKLLAEYYPELEHHEERQERQD